MINSWDDLVMNTIVGPFIQNPAGIFLVSGLFFAAYMLTKGKSMIANPKGLLWPATAWAIWAIWEFLIVWFSPEANIRVDLLLIVPIIAISILWGLYSAFVAR